MTKDEFLDNEKKRGFIIYRCSAKDCTFRGYGAATFYHELHNERHFTYNEDRPEEKDNVQRINS